MSETDEQVSNTTGASGREVGAAPPFRREEPLELLAEAVGGAFSVGPPADPVAGRIAEVLTEEHVGTLIANTDAVGRRKHEAAKQREWFRLGLAVVILGTIVGLCWLLLAYGATDHLDAILTAAIGAAGGFGAGWATARNK